MLLTIKEGVKMEITTKQGQSTASIRLRTPVAQLKEELGKAYGEIGMLLGQQSTGPSGPPFAVYHNMDMNDLDVEIGFPVAHPIRAEGRMKASVLPAGPTAVAVHKGPYEAMEQAYKDLMGFIQKHAAEAQGLCYEVYLNDPQSTKPEDLLTEINFPLKA
jgi:effector-binding domain-containing protein